MAPRDSAPAAGADSELPARRVVEHLIAISPVAEHWGIELVDAEPGAVSLAMTVRPDMANTHGVCHGGVLFSLADFCFGFAANSYNDRAMAASCDIRFLQSAEVGDRVTARAQEIWKRGRSGLYDVTIINQKGEMVAVMRGHSRLVGGLHVERG